MNELDKYLEALEWITISIKSNNNAFEEEKEKIMNNLALCFLNHNHTIKKKDGNLQIKI